MSSVGSYHMLVARFRAKRGRKHMGRALLIIVIAIVAAIALRSFRRPKE